jgi:hypothetical protein
MPSSATAIVEVPAPIEEAFGFLANIENAAAWWPFVVGSVSHVRALRRRADVRRLRKRAATVLPHALRSLSLARLLPCCLALLVARMLTRALLLPHLACSPTVPPRLALSS